MAAKLKEVRLKDIPPINYEKFNAILKIDGLIADPRVIRFDPSTNETVVYGFTKTAVNKALKASAVDVDDVMLRMRIIAKGDMRSQATKETDAFLKTAPFPIHDVNIITEAFHEASAYLSHPTSRMTDFPLIGMYAKSLKEEPVDMAKKIVSWRKAWSVHIVGVEQQRLEDEAAVDAADTIEALQTVFTEYTERLDAAE